MQEFNILDLIVSLIITIAVYSLPIIIYRYAILKHAVEKNRAKMITIIYAIVGFFAMNAITLSTSGKTITGGALLFWSYANYKMLTTSKDKKKTAVDPLQASDNSGLADCKTGKCAGREKRRFKFSWKTFLVVVLCLVLASAITISILQHLEIVGLRGENADLQSTLDKTEKSLQINRDRLKSTIAQRNEYRNIANFFDEHAVFVTRESGQYHHYWCEHVKDREYWIYNIEYAEHRGYQPCPDCCS